MAGLDTYRDKRDFTRNPEPPPQPGSATATGRSFAVQKHAARRLHYDLRLEHDGVLLSWAIPRGPSADPSSKRLAVRTEDHPVDYARFEGVIPEGYGAGTVMLWDRSEWEPEGDVAEGLDAGKLRFRVKGARMRGGWALIRLRGDDGQAQETWLLMKERDAATERGDALTRPDTSVLSGRTLDEIRRDAPEREAGPGSADDAPHRAPEDDRQQRPAFRPPKLATLVDEVPDGAVWLFEPKHDGYRFQIAVGHGGARLWSRNGLDWTDRAPDLAAAAEALPCRTALIDGEVVSAQRETFSALQAALQDGGPLVFYAFDLLEQDGEDLAARPLRAVGPHWRRCSPDRGAAGRCGFLQRSRGTARRCWPRSARRAAKG